MINEEEITEKMNPFLELQQRQQMEVELLTQILKGNIVNEWLFNHLFLVRLQY